MNIAHKISFFLLRVAIGWLFFYSGITKIMDKSWSAAGYIKGAKTFTHFYQILLRPEYIGWVNFANEWGLTLVGASLVVGFAVRYSSFFGIILMLLYYFPILEFPAVAHSYIADEHIIYALVLLLFIVFKAGKFWGIDGFMQPAKYR